MLLKKLVSMSEDQQRNQNHEPAAEEPATGPKPAEIPQQIDDNIGNKEATSDELNDMLR
tara:strand:+ start:2341 stop:2517 length:177 start_codon:yes stop_codon:yes gene_type:complete